MCYMTSHLHITGLLCSLLLTVAMLTVVTIYIAHSRLDLPSRNQTLLPHTWNIKLLFQIFLLSVMSNNQIFFFISKICKFSFYMFHGRIVNSCKKGWHTISQSYIPHVMKLVGKGGKIPTTGIHIECWCLKEMLWMIKIRNLWSL